MNLGTDSYEISNLASVNSLSERHKLKCTENEMDSMSAVTILVLQICRAMRDGFWAGRR